MIRRLLPPALLLALLSGCSILPKSQALDVYPLPAQPLAAAEQAPLALSLRVNKPLTSPLLNSTRIAVMPEDGRISVYQGARWSDRAPLLLRDRLIDAFRDNGRFQAVSSDDSRLHADLVLDGDLRAFHSEYQNGKPAARILLAARLVEAGSQRILASKRFEITQYAADSTLPAVIRAFGQAGDQLAQEVLQWTLSQPPINR
jgi:cholesterol transport system auxiliary component